MNILYLCDEYPPGRHGGIGSAVQALAGEMVKKGHLVVVAGFYHWGYDGANYFENEGVKVYRFRRGLASKWLIMQDRLHVRIFYRLLKDSGAFNRDIKKSIIKYHVFLEQLIDEYKIDIVEMPDYNDYMRYCDEVIFFPQLSVPTIVKTHGGMTYIANENGLKVPAVIWQMEHSLLMQARAICSVSKYNGTKTVEYLAYPYPFTVLYNGIDTKKVIPIATKIPGKVIFTGSLNKNKGIYELLEAWNIVNEVMPNATLDILGKGPVAKIKKILTNSALKTTFFYGHVDKTTLYRKLAQANVAIFPSFAESFALAPMEAMLCNTAVIYTKRASGPELIEDEVSGYLVEPTDVAGIADKIIYLLNNSEVCAEIATKGRQVILDKFDISIIAHQNEEFYYNILKSDNYVTLRKD